MEQEKNENKVPPTAAYTEVSTQASHRVVLLTDALSILQAPKSDRDTGHNNLSAAQQPICCSTTYLLLNNLSAAQQPIYCTTTYLLLNNLSTAQQPICCSTTYLLLNNLSTAQQPICCSCLPLQKPCSHPAVDSLPVQCAWQ